MAKVLDRLFGFEAGRSPQPEWSRAFRALAQQGDIDDQLTVACRLVCEHLSCDRASVFLDDGRRYRARVNHGNPPDIARSFLRHRVPHDDPLIALAVAEDRVVVLDDALGASVMNPRTARQARIHAIMVAPILPRPDGVAAGFLTAEHNERRGSFSIGQERWLRWHAELAGLCVASHLAHAPLPWTPATEAALTGTVVYLAADDARRLEGSRLLSRLGVTVLGAADPQTAMQLLLHREPPPWAVICDGIEAPAVADLVDQVAQFFPQTEVIDRSHNGLSSDHDLVARLRALEG